MKDLRVLSSMLKLLQQDKIESHHGKVFGLVADDAVYAIALCGYSNEGELGHDPTRLLPVPLTCLGNFTKGVIKEKSMPDLQVGDMNFSFENNTFTITMMTKEKLSPQEYSLIAPEELYDTFLVARVAFSFNLSHTWVEDCNETHEVEKYVSMLDSPSACFLLQDTTCILQNNEDGVLSLGGVANSAEESVTALLKDSSKGKSMPSIMMESLRFQLLFNTSLAETRNAPVVQVDSTCREFHSAGLTGEVVVYMNKTAKISILAAQLVEGVTDQLEFAQFWLSKQSHASASKLSGTLTSMTVLPVVGGYFLNVIYPANAEETSLLKYRMSVHKTFLFPPDRPMVRKSNQFHFHDETPSGSTPLQNTHIGLKPSGVGGQVFLVQGIYSYHHYMQDRFDDNKWGCAYRSLQTLVSWLRHQGYTEHAVPTHREVQQCLVDLGDKEPNFVGSRQWIGSTEVGFVLDSMFGVTAKFMAINSGLELANRGRELAMHFQNQGTPIMVGGGVLAHTIIGVDWDENTGDISFLVLDPHYTGGDDLLVIQKQGWCGWKKTTFWDANAFYNLCLPQRPKLI